VPMDGGRDRGFGASRGPAEKIMVPDRSAENAMAAFSAAMVAFNSVYPAFSGAGPDYGAPTRRRPRPSTRTLSVQLIRRARQTDLFIKKGKTLIATKTSIGKTLFSNPADDLRIISKHTSIDFALARACARTRAGGGEKLTKFRDGFARDSLLQR